MAHLLEHMPFKGTPTHPDIPGALKRRGAQMNGSTSPDRTNYFETLPAEGDNLEFALRLEADRMVNSFVRKEDLDSEMTVVRNEFERSENDPSRILRQRIFALAFDWHNYGKSTIGIAIHRHTAPDDRRRKSFGFDEAIIGANQSGQLRPRRVSHYEHPAGIAAAFLGMVVDPVDRLGHILAHLLDRAVREEAVVRRGKDKSFVHERLGFDLYA